jgi:hypothetical protein
MPSYHIDIACFVADVERKWIDNFLSRVDVAGAESSGHGVVRRLTIGAVRQIALTRLLVQDLGLSIERAASLAGALIAKGGEVRGPAGLTVRIDLVAFEAGIDRRLADGVEAVVLARRGRPPGTRTPLR